MTPPLATRFTTFGVDRRGRGESDDHVGGPMQDLLATFLHEGPRLPEAELTALRAGPSWQARVADAVRILREVRLVEGYRPDEKRLQRYDCAVLLLTGTVTAPHALAATDYLSEALRNARVVTMRGEGHMEMHTAPDVLAREVASFVAASFTDRSRQRDVEERVPER